MTPERSLIRCQFLFLRWLPGHSDVGAGKSSKATFMKGLGAWKTIGPCLELVEGAMKPITFGPHLQLLLP